MKYRTARLSAPLGRRCACGGRAALSNGGRQHAVIKLFGGAGMAPVVACPSLPRGLSSRERRSQNLIMAATFAGVALPHHHRHIRPCRQAYKYSVVARLFGGAETRGHALLAK